MQDSTLHDRIRAAVGARSYRQLGSMTRTHPETVRRYFLGKTPSVEFLTRLCQGLDLNGEWLLTGRGPMHQADIRLCALRSAIPSELLNAQAATLEGLTQRVERLELFLQTMEVRLRSHLNGLSSDDGQAAPLQVSTRVRGIAEAVSDRAFADAS